MPMYGLLLHFGSGKVPLQRQSTCASICMLQAPRPFAIAQVSLCDAQSRSYTLQRQII